MKLAPAHNKCTSRTYTERRAERARVEVEDKDVSNILKLLTDTQLTSYTDFCQASAKKAPNLADCFLVPSTNQCYNQYLGPLSFDFIKKWYIRMCTYLCISLLKHRWELSWNYYIIPTAVVHHN